MTNLRILLLNALYIFGGGEYFTFLLARYLSQNGHEVIVSCPGDSILNRKCKKEKIKVYSLEYPRFGKGNLRRIIGELKKIIKENNLQIVHSNTNFDRTAGAFATIRTGAVHTASVHSFYSIRRNLTHIIRNKYYIKHFIASGEKIKRLLIEKDNISSDRVTSIELGIAPQEFLKDITARKRIRKEFNISDNDIVIGNVGRLVKFKGQENLIRAFEMINRKYSNTKLIITGNGELECSLLELCEKLSVKDKVIFAGFREDMQEIYSAFDIYVHPSLAGMEELFPFAILYAMAQGLPIVATDTGEISKMVRNDINGKLINSSEPELIAKEIEQLIIDRERRESFGLKSLHLLNEKFTIGKMGSAITKIYESIL